MIRKQYNFLAIINSLLGACAIFLYFPFALECFNVKGGGWMKLLTKMFKSNLLNVMIYFGLGLLIFIIAINVLSLIINPNKAKLCFKFATILALSLPLLFVAILKFDWALEFWVKNVVKNIKLISYVLISTSCGLAVLGIIYNLINKSKANLFLILQGVACIMVLVLLVYVNGWCGWNLTANKLLKLSGVLYATLAVYLPLSSVALMLCSKTRNC